MFPVKVCDNVGDHLIGNVYARYEWEAEAQAAVDNLNDRWYAGKFLIGAAMTDHNTQLGSPRNAQADRCTRSCLPSRTSVNRAAGKTRTANVIEEGFAISCIYGLLPRTSYLDSITARSWSED